jgi:DNA repair protein RadC
VGRAEPVSTAAKVVEYMRGGFDELPLNEQFYVIVLNRKNRPMGRHRVTVGTQTAALAHPREVFRIAVMASAAAIICVHNHPSGVMPHPVLCRTAPWFHSEDGHRHAA